MIARIPWVLVCLSFILGTAQAVDARAWDIEAEAQLGFEARTFPSVIGQARASENWITSLFDVSIQSGRFRRWFGSARIMGQYLVDSPTQVWNQSGSPQYLEEQELSIEYRYRRHRFRLGTTTVRWGILDLYDPLDQVNSRRFENPIASEKRGDPMLLWSFSRPARQVSTNFEAFYIPKKKRSLLPSETSAWLPREVYVPNLADAEFILPESLIYQYDGFEELNQSLSHAYGLRVVIRSESLEAALQYDEGASSFPNVRPEVTGTIVAVPPQSDRTRIQADPLIRLTEVYYRERHFGGSMTKSFSDSLLRLQLARSERLYAGRELARDRTDLSVGFEKSIGRSTLLSQLYINLLQLDSESSSGTGNDLASMSSLFDRAAALGLRYPIGDSSSILIGAMYSTGSQTDGETTIAMTNLSLAVSDSVSLDLGIQIIESGSRGPLAPFAKNDGGSLKLTALF